jgi:hypothetical protein
VRAFSISLTTCLAVIFSCLLWIGGISWVVVAVLGLSSAAGWVIAGTLGGLAIVAIGILVHEVRHAIDLPDDVDLELMDAFTMDPFPEVNPISPKLRANRVSRVHARH